MGKLFTRITCICAMLLSIQFSFGQQAVNAYGQLSVSGTKIVSSTGADVQLRGMSLFWSNWQGKYYDYNTVKWLRDDWCLNVVRAAMAVDVSGQGYMHSKAGELAKVETVIDAAIDLGVYVIVDFHSHYASSNNEKALATEFFDHISSKYGSYPNIIYEPFNEPLGVSWTNELKPFYNDIIATIRANDPDNIIVLGTPNWDQDVDDAADSPMSQSNIAYTLHYYAASHKQDKRNKASYALSKGICLFVTEYGICEASGNGYIDEAEANTWWTFLDNNKISYCNWAVSDKDEAASALASNAPASGNWSANQLRQSGTIVRANMVANCPDYGTTQTPTYVNIPSKIEAEDFTAMSGIQTEVTDDAGGGSNVGYIDDADWIEFRVDAQTTGTFDIDYRVASNGATGAFTLQIDGSNEHNVTVPNTGGWQTWVTVSETAYFTEGEHTIRILATGGGWNINYIDFIKNGIIDCNGIMDGTASIDDCGVCSGGNTGKTPNSTCTQDCNNEWGGTASIDNCNICSGGSTNIVPNSTCSGGCQPGQSTTGIYDDFTLEEAPFHLEGGVFFWGEAELAGDNNPNHRSVLTRNATAERLEINLTQGQDEYVPFGISFGETSPGVNIPIDLTNDATFEIEITNTSNQDIKLALAIQDINGNNLNTNSTAAAETFANAWQYEIATNIPAGESATFTGNFEGAFFADYNNSELVATFDYTKVTTFMFTIVNQANTGTPNFQPLSLTNVGIQLHSVRLGDCANAYNYNDRIFDCNGDLDGTAEVDQCDKCSGGNTGVTVDECLITGVNNVNANQLALYPNPTSNNVQISGEFQNWELIDFMGHQIKTGDNQNIDLSEQQAGVYLIKVDDKLFKVVKQ